MTKPRVYQAGDGRWLVFNNDIKSDYFNTEGEAINMATKLTWMAQAQAESTTLAQVADGLANLESVYFDRGYDSGGSNPITDGDASPLTAANYAALITLIQQLNNFLGNSAVTPADYDATLNTLRTDV